MNRSDLGLLGVAPLVLYAVARGVGSLGSWPAAALLGLLAAVAQVAGIYRRDLAVLVWLPGLFLFVVLFTVSGITVNPIPGALGELVGGWAVGTPIFALLALWATQRSPGRRAVLLTVTLLASAAALLTVSAGPFQSPVAYAQVFVQIPREQAAALGAILAGGASTSAPFVLSTSPTFAFLAMLAGAGGLAALLGVDATEDPERLGHEGAAPHHPGGAPVRSLLTEGRGRLDEATPPERPLTAETASLPALLAAAAAGVATLLAAGESPDWLIPGIAIATIALLAGTLFVIRGRSSPAARRPTAEPTPGEPT